MPIGSDAFGDAHMHAGFFSPWQQLFVLLEAAGLPVCSHVKALPE